MLLPECAELDAYRLARDWTFQQLSDAMREIDINLAPRTLHYILKRAPVGHRPLDRTLYKINLFLKHVRAVEARRASRRKSARKPDTQSASASS